MAEESKREKRKAEWLSQALAEKERSQLQKQLRDILRKDSGERSSEQLAMLEAHNGLVEEISSSIGASEQRKKIKAEHAKEIEDPPEVFEAKLQELARLLKTSARVVFHTGAGLSTAAGIPDFRGPQGVWTLQKKGQAVEMNMRYEDAVPTRAHMVIGEMVRRGVVMHVVSQNVDGLLLRAGVPHDRLSELHGCVYTEQCPSCGRLYTRGYDVTAANGTALRRHSTGGICRAVIGPRRATSAEGLDAGAVEAGPATSAEGVGAVRAGPATSADGSDGGRVIGKETNGAESVNAARVGAENERRAEEAGRRGDTGVPVLSAEQATFRMQVRAREEAQACPENAEGGDVRVEGVASVQETAASCGDEERAVDANQDSREYGGAEAKTIKPTVKQTVKKRTKEESERKLGPEGGYARAHFDGADSFKDRGVEWDKEALCGGQLRDTIVHFGERLDADTLRTARDASAGADLAVVLGTTLKVPPASTLPGLAKTLVIINLQWTAKDKKAALKINGRCENVMERLAQLLVLEVPDYAPQGDPVLQPGDSDRGRGTGKSTVEASNELKSSISVGRKPRQNKLRAKASFPRPFLQ